MKASTAIGIGLACAGLLLGAMMEGSQVGSFLDPPAILIVFGGTLGATLASTSLESIKRIPSLYKRAMSAEHHDMSGRVDLLVSLAEKARREGLLFGRIRNRVFAVHQADRSSVVWEAIRVSALPNGDEGVLSPVTRPVGWRVL